MGDAPFFCRAAALIAFLGAASLLELAVRGGRAVRWRGSVVIVGCGVLGSAVGFGIDLVNSAISPAYFAVGKGLGWGDGLVSRASVLGLQAGASAGVVAGGVLAHAGFRAAGGAALPVARIMSRAFYPLVGAVSCGVAFGCVSACHPLPCMMRVVSPVLSPGQEGAFVAVWSAHIGVYAGGILGLAAAVGRVCHERGKAGASADEHVGAEESALAGR